MIEGYKQSECAYTCFPHVKSMSNKIKLIMSRAVIKPNMESSTLKSESKYCYSGANDSYSRFELASDCIQWTICSLWYYKSSFTFYDTFLLFPLLYFSQKQLPSAWNESDWLTNCRHIHIVKLRENRKRFSWKFYKFMAYKVFWRMTSIRKIQKQNACLHVLHAKKKESFIAIIAMRFT